MRSSHSKKQSGFSLIELMIVVAILGILAAVAVPAFTKFMYKSKASEVPAILDGIIKSEQAYYGANDLFLGLTDPIAATCPLITMGNKKCPTTVADFAVATTGYPAIQFSPSGNVYGHYEASVRNAAGVIYDDPGNPTTYTVVNIGGLNILAKTDIDFDIKPASWGMQMGIAEASGDIYVSPKIEKSDDDF